MNRRLLTLALPTSFGMLAACGPDNDIPEDEELPPAATSSTGAAVGTGTATPTAGGTGTATSQAIGTGASTATGASIGSETTVSESAVGTE